MNAVKNMEQPQATYLHSSAHHSTDPEKSEFITPGEGTFQDQGVQSQEPNFRLLLVFSKRWRSPSGPKKVPGFLET